MFKFSLEDIKIGKVMAHDRFLDTEHKRTAVSREYSYIVNGNRERIFLYDEYKKGEEYEGKYLLQDIAYSYKKLNKNSDDLLLFVEKTIENDLGKIKVFAISTYNCFDETLSVEIDLEYKSKDGLSNKDINKIKSIFDIADFVNEKIVVFSNERHDFIKEIVNSCNLRIKEKDLVYLSVNEIKAFFKQLLPFKRSSSFRNFLIASSIGFFLAFILITSSFDASGDEKTSWESSLSIKQNEAKKIEKRVKSLKIQQEKLFLETSSIKKKFDPNTMNIN